tara:strand:- start:343 stop:912 length:570 start_codon:yes stop_codon:yes gene_type:complete
LTSLFRQHLEQQDNSKCSQNLSRIDHNYSRRRDRRREEREEKREEREEKKRREKREEEKRREKREKEKRREKREEEKEALLYVPIPKQVTFAAWIVLIEDIGLILVEASSGVCKVDIVKLFFHQPVSHVTTRGESVGEDNCLTRVQHALNPRPVIYISQIALNIISKPCNISSLCKGKIQRSITNNTNC